LKLLILEPYWTGSHAAWAEGYAAASAHKVDILSLPGRFWKWRMHGGALTLAREFMARDETPDLMLATDMLDLTTFLAMTRARTANLPVAVYFHENQLSYPWSPTDRDVQQQRDHHYGFINIATALAADRVLFNSAYHRESFLGAAEKLLRHFPDHNELTILPEIEKKSEILPLGFAFDRLEQARPTAERTGPPTILWNHRWEYDKNPAVFFKALTILAERGLEFQVIVLGENFRQQPAEFADFREKFGDRLLQCGYAESYEEYARWLWRADILPVTSIQDFFGVSITEAIYCDTFPLLPRRLAYPEIIPPEKEPDCYYDGVDDLPEKLEKIIRNIENYRIRSLKSYVESYRWQLLAVRYDEIFKNLREEGKVVN